MPKKHMETSSLLHSEAMVGLLPGAESSSGLGHLLLGVFSGHDTPQGMCSLRMQILEKNNKKHR